VEDKNSSKDFLKNLEEKIKKKKKKTPLSPKKNSGMGNRVTLILLLVFVVFTFIIFNNPGTSPESTQISYSELIDNIKNKKVSELTVVNNDMARFRMDGKAYDAQIPLSTTVLEPLLIENNVSFKYEKEEDSKFLIIALNFLPWIILMLFFWFIISRQFRGKGGGAFSFGRSKAKLVNSAEIRETFKDVEGCQESKEELKEIISFLKDPKKYTDIGAKIPKGVLLTGPPGTGKTLLAKAVAGEAKVPFFSMSGSDFVEMFVGVGASRVRDLFENGKKNAPCIIFIDELDAVGRMRGAGYGGGHDEREQTLNQMLVEMDGFDTNDSVIIMAATNRSDVLDHALLRPGRFDRQIVVDIPDAKGRLGILKIHVAKIKLEPDVDLDKIARSTIGFTGADIANMVNESAILAARKDKKSVGHDDFESARDKVMMGTERKSMMISPEEKKNTAYHEAGHTLVGILEKNANMLHKVSIIPRGRALGQTYFLPEDGQYTLSRSKAEAQLMVSYGGRVAEEVMFGDYSNGAANDIQTVTKIARAMVCEWGMSRLGPIAFGEQDQPIFIGREITQKEEQSDYTLRKVDGEIKFILDKAYKDVVTLIKKNKDKLVTIAQLLLEKETVSVEEVYDRLKLKKPKQLSEGLLGTPNNKAGTKKATNEADPGKKVSGEADPGEQAEVKEKKKDKNDETPKSPQDSQAK